MSLTPSFRIIYDSDNYGVGRDDFIVKDMDDDGAYEISQEVTAFYGFADMAPAETPLPRIIFKYDAAENRYLPANHLLKDYALRDVEERKARVRAKAEVRLSDVLSITLDYIYAGEEQEAWTYFDAEYRQPNKAEMKTEIMNVLRDEPVYKLISCKTVLRRTPRSTT